MATIKDVARLAGCSIKTVSRVINNEPYVTPETRARVLAAIRASGYAPNLSARRLVQNRSFSICILMYPGFYQPASQLLTRIMDIGYEENYEILIQTYFPTRVNARNKLAELVNERRYDGFITTPPCDADGFVADLLQTYKIPLVQVNPLDRSSSIPYVAGEDYRGAYQMTEYLISLGHCRISFLRGPRNMRSSFDRLDGFHAALQAHGLTADPSLEIDTEFTFDGGYWATRLLLQRPDMPTAIYAGNDEAAFGALFALQEAGRRVPEQVSVCGHDDLLFSKYVFPGLTTVHQPSEQIVEQAVRLLIGILKGSAPQNTQVIIPSHIVVRHSTASPPHSN
ncbi:MAG: LacI family DNA-binding transcriptional regulator [Anaerolineae bacterium]|nr:LacI family DNA-binding transcriptional regulator [Anaerolineae bacterium]